MNSKQIFGVVLLIVSAAVATSAQESLFTIVSDKDAIIRSVLEAESQRQPQYFPNVRILSTENINPGKDILIDKNTFKLVDPITLRNRVTDGMGVNYLMFASFRRERESVIVTLADVSEGVGCFGPYYKNVSYETYVAHKDNFGWRAEFRYRSSPQPPMKPLGNSFLLKGRER